MFYSTLRQRVLPRNKLYLDHEYAVNTRMNVMRHIESTIRILQVDRVKFNYYCTSKKKSLYIFHEYCTFAFNVLFLVFLLGKYCCHSIFSFTKV